MKNKNNLKKHNDKLQSIQTDLKKLTKEDDKNNLNIKSQDLKCEKDGNVFSKKDKIVMEVELLMIKISI